ncbi:AI-2E family transporter [Microbacterium sp. ARD31]|uniref:AI-2E family transporter n=1 Tax=Microbacterium sp. ARD31 TaxID=2962576 RepID=UPI0028824567|nr:AI-2E family transporter [Microbacterium sp. ARD31]MDT0182596.1 AI-2E family transporter [Microbacterium sp. ARD31]
MTDGSSSPVPSAPSPRDRADSHRFVWAGLSQPFAVGFTVTLGALVALLLGLALGSLSTVLIYILFALFAALGLDPAVRWLQSRNVSRTWSIVIVFTAFALVLVGVLLLVIPTLVRQVASFITDLPQSIANFMRTDFFIWLESTFGDSVGTILDEVQNFLLNPSNIAAIGGGVLQVGVGIATGISGVIIVIVLTLYFIATLPSMKQSLYRLSPARNRAKLAELTEQITDSVGGYLMGMVVLAFFNAMFTLLLHLLIGLPFPALMAVVAFCITIIPLVGPVLFWIIGTFVALFDSPLSALIFAAAYLVYMQIEAYVVTPRVMNRTVSVPGSLVVIGALVGGTLLGLLGALIAIPVTASILLIIKQVVIPRQDAKV